MSNILSEQITDLKNVLTGFILEQREFNWEQMEFNSEQRQFNSEQRQFNISIDKKIDKVQYFLEETIADNAKMFFEEQIALKTNIREIEADVSGLKADTLELTSQFRSFQKSV